MKTEEIIAGNRLLADFMGFQQTSIGWFDNDGVLSIAGDNTFDELRFKESWDWLMPVVEKIESIEDNFGGQRFNVQIEQCFCCIIENRTSHDIVIFDSDTKMEAVFAACVEFAKWYKNQSKMTKAEKLSEKISEIYFFDEFLDNFIYLTNPSRGNHVSKNKLIASYHNGTFGQLLSKYDSIAFHCMEL